MNDETHYAFPHKFQSAPDELTICFGMTLRDYFAAKAMAAYWSDPNVAVDQKTAAAWAYDMADAMMKVRDAE